jgi:hypothetical protein
VKDRNEKNVNERTKEACAQIKEKIKIVSESKGGGGGGGSCTYMKERN